VCGFDVAGQYVGALKKLYRRNFWDIVSRWDEPETLLFVWLPDGKVQGTMGLTMETAS